MPLSRNERFRLKTQIVEEIESNRDWDFTARNRLLNEFGLSSLHDRFDAPTFDDQISKIGDNDLREMFSIVLKSEADKAAVETTEGGPWKSGLIRLFISHSAAHKEQVGWVADELALVGIHGFVAHDTMTPGAAWQAQIETALRTMDVFVAFVHPEFNDSAWCEQEVGWALGAGTPRWIIRMGADPAGFIGREQWVSGFGQSPRQLASLIGGWIASLPEFGEALVGALLVALEGAGSFIDADNVAKKISSLGSLTVQQWATLDKIYHANNQVSGGALAHKTLRPFYQQNGRTWPPEAS